MFGATPVRTHLDLYNYWSAKRGDQPFPLRAAIDPAEMRALLPHLVLVQAVGRGQFRYRLTGTRVVSDFGREVTGTLVGSHLSTRAGSMRTLYAPVCEDHQPRFVVGNYRAVSGAVHAVSRLLLPLGMTGDRADLVLISRVTRFPRNAGEPIDWLGEAVGNTDQVTMVADAGALECLATEWERRFVRVPELT